MKLTALSGLGCKGPACFLFETAGRRLLLDLGRGPDGDALPDLSGVPPVDAILISHGHVDHTGGLHLAALLGNPPILAPEPSIALSPDPTLRSALPLEGRDEIAGIPFTSGPGGHAPGARWLRLGGEGGLLYTGDMSRESTLYPWSLPPRAAAMLFDASYGTADEALADQMSALLALADRPLLLPAPAGGRGLEMALAFRAAGVPVALCAAHRQVAAVMADRPAALPDGGADRLRRLLDDTVELTPDSPAQGVMIAAGPNAERGVAGALAPRFLAEGRARVVFTGHLAEGSPAVAMVAAGQARFLRWNVHPTLSETRLLLDAVQPHHAMPAFCKPPTAAALAVALDRPLVTEREVTW